MKKISVLVLFFNSCLYSASILHKSLGYQTDPASKAAIIHSAQAKDTAIKSKLLEKIANKYWVGLKDGKDDLYNLITQETERHGYKEQGLVAEDIQEIKKLIKDFRLFNDVEIFGFSKLPQWLEEIYENYQENFLDFTLDDKYNFLGPKNIRKSIVNFIIQEWNKGHNKPSEYFFVKKVFRADKVVVNEALNLQTFKDYKERFDNQKKHFYDLYQKYLNAKIYELQNDAGERTPENFSQLYTLVNNFKSFIENECINRTKDISYTSTEVSNKIHKIKDEIRALVRKIDEDVEKIKHNSSQTLWNKMFTSATTLEQALESLNKNAKESYGMCQPLMTIVLIDLDTSRSSQAGSAKEKPKIELTKKIKEDIDSKLRDAQGAFVYIDDVDQDQDNNLVNLALEDNQKSIEYVIVSDQDNKDQAKQAKLERMLQKNPGLKVILAFDDSLTKIEDNFRVSPAIEQLIIAGINIAEVGSWFLKDCAGLISLTLPDGVTKIGDLFLARCTGLTSLTLHDGVTKIGNRFLEDCAGLTSLTLPAGLTEIESYFLYNCTALISLTLPDSITKIGNGFLERCRGLTSLSLPAGLTEIEDDFLLNCTGLTSLILPDGVTEIGDDFLSGCIGLTSLSLPAGLTEIEDGFLLNCTGLTSLTLPAGLTKIGRQFLFKSTGLTSLRIHKDTLTRLGGREFFGNNYPWLLKILEII